MRRFFSIAIAFLSVSSRAAFAYERAALIGDDFMVGAGAHPDLEFSAEALLPFADGRQTLKAERRLLRNDWSISEDLPRPPRRLLPSHLEFKGALDWVYRHLAHLLISRTFERPEFGWGYLLARKLGIAPENISVAGESGARVADSLRLTARVVSGGPLPELFVIGFLGHDICSNIETQVIDGPAYAMHIENAIRLMATVTKERPLKVVVVLPFSQSQLILREDIQKKVVKAYGEEVTCAELRQRSFLPRVNTPLKEDPNVPAFYALAQRLLPPNPAALCPALFAPGIPSEERLTFVANRLRAYRDGVMGMVTKLPSTIDVQVIDPSSAFIVGADDVAQDCFHLSLSGQERFTGVVAVQLK